MRRRLFLSIPFGAAACGGKERAWNEGLAKTIERAVIDTMTDSAIPGLSIAVGNRENVVWERAFGDADLENEAPVKVTSLFRIASLSKPITAVAVLQLVEKGKIKLDADIREYVPEFPEKRMGESARS